MILCSLALIFFFFFFSYRLIVIFNLHLLFCTSFVIVMTGQVEYLNQKCFTEDFGHHSDEQNKTKKNKVMQHCAHLLAFCCMNYLCSVLLTFQEEQAEVSVFLRSMQQISCNFHAKRLLDLAACTRQRFNLLLSLALSVSSE